MAQLLHSTLFRFMLPALIGLLAVSAGRAQILELPANARISVIGNTLADRMQHDGWLESLVQARFPDKKTVFRELGFSGDELELRLRSQDFGSPDEWLKRCQTDVVIAMFGYNESFADQEGIDEFEKRLKRFITRTRSQNYNGRSSPTIVLVSPHAFEDLTATPMGAGLPDGNEHNRRLALYTGAMQRVAGSENVFFVDLFGPSLRQWQSAGAGPYTLNGVHLLPEGNRFIAEIIDTALFGQALSRDEKRLEAIRQAVLDKNRHWFHRYRTTDGYSIYGGRADLAFTDGQTNREVAQRELEVLDYMTASRDKVIHAVAAGNTGAPDDSGAPPLIPVISNKPGDGPEGKHIFLGGEEAIRKMKIQPGLSVNLFASEEQFPELASPVQMSFDTRGRLWVAVWPTYPHWQPLVEEMNDKLLIFSDTDGDGRADEMKVFADGLHNPTGFEFWNGGVLLAQAPDIWFLKDTDGDDIADIRQRVLHGIDSADTHHTANSFVYGPDGAMYFQEGTFHHSQIESPWEKPLRQVNAGVFRFDPRIQTIESYISYGFANPHGHVFDEWGQDFVTDGTGNVNYYAAPFSGHLEYPAKHSGYFPFFQQWVRPSGATELVSGGHFPESMQGNYLIANVIGFQGLLNYRVEEAGSGFSATEAEPILSSTDPNFRPVDIEIGPDGAIYFLDWQNPIIGHMQHNLRDPNRDKVHGRVYRVTCDGRPLDPVTDLHRMAIPDLLKQLELPHARNRYRARIELSGRDSREVLAAVAARVGQLDPKDARLEHHLLELLWITRQHNSVDETLLERVLTSSEPRARAAAVRVLCYSRHQCGKYLERMKRAVNDPHPRVRLEAVRALSFEPSAAAAEIALRALDHETDPFIDYCLNETLRATENAWRPALVSGESFAADHETGLRHVLARLSPSELAGVRSSPVVNRELLVRAGVLNTARMKAASQIAAMRGTDPRTVILDLIGELDAESGSDSESVLADLTHLFLHGDGISPHRPVTGQETFAPYVDKLRTLAEEGSKSITRQIAYSTLMQAGQPVEELWQSAQQSPARFRDLVAGMAIVDTAEIKAELAERVAGLFQSLPMTLEQTISDQPSVKGRYVRIELPGDQRTLTLAEVQVFSGERNVATGGSATQSADAHGGTAGRAIDGDTNPVYAAGSQSHTPENRKDPWWQVDLGESVAINRVVVWNRVEQDFGKRLDGFVLKILDDGNQVVYTSEPIPAPERSVSLSVAGDPRGEIREAAILAAAHLSPGDQQTFSAFADLILNGLSRTQAVRGMARLPRRSWVEPRIEELIKNIVDHLAGLTVGERTRPSALDEISLARNLVTALPPEAASPWQKQLNELGVTVVVLRPVPHRMQYDRNQFYVEAGKPFQLVLDNTDIMPHNVVITSPGAYAKVGIAAELMTGDPSSSGTNYVPNMPEVLFASRLLQPGQVQQMEIVAPKTPGDYPYVCTYPGHWRRMYGVMHVVEDIASAPVEAFAPTVDSEVALRPFVREWALADFRDAGDSFEEAPSFERARALFTELSCAQCHKVGEAGQGDIGPNLHTVRDRMVNKELDREKVLQSLVEPSADIEEKYRTWILLDLDGRVHTGVIAERTEETIRLLANPLDKGEAVTLNVGDIEEERESPVSMMPAGLLNTCSRQEILELLLYIETGGDSAHPGWQVQGALAR
jgi:putative heme-binding domain-containing protein